MASLVTLGRRKPLGSGVWIPLALGAVLLFSGCASGLRAARGGREGLFDRWERRQPHGVSENSAAGERDPSRGESDGAVRGGGKARAVTSESRMPVSSRDFKLRWPLDQVEITSRFGNRGESFHEGVDLRAQVGTPVVAAQSGVVIYAGAAIDGYGRMIVIRHPKRIATVYAHNSRLLVKKGQKVEQGQRIALSGKTGRASGPHVHFEVRTGVSPVDPTLVLPPARKVASSR